MKRVLSLIMVIGMLFAVLALASCGDDPVETTTAQETTTETTTTEQTTTEQTTTEQTTTTETTTVEETTTTVEETTTTVEETTTTVEETTTETTTVDPTATTYGDFLTLYTRFDFGTESRVQQENAAKGVDLHQWILDNISYNKEYLLVNFDKDTMTVYALKDYNEDTMLGTKYYTIEFGNIQTYDFEDMLTPGFGTWNNAPYVTPTTASAWKGMHQYMQIRCQNNSNNNIMSVEFAKAIGAYYTTQIATNLYLQGGAPTAAPATPVTAGSQGANRYAKDYMTEMETFTYDMNFLSHCGRNWVDSYADMVAAVIQAPNGCGSNGWNWCSGAEVVGIRFNLLGAYSGNRQKAYLTSDYYQCDTRDLIKEGASMIVDYIIFGSTPAQLDDWKSIDEGYTMPAVETTEAAA